MKTAENKNQKSSKIFFGELKDEKILPLPIEKVDGTEPILISRKSLKRIVRAHEKEIKKNFISRRQK